jgi:hypothetical protein
VELSIVSRIKEAPTYLNLLPLASTPLDISSLFIPTDLVLSLLKPKFTGPYI